MKHRIRIDPDGTVTCVYSEGADLVGFMRRLGESNIRRASHVEPTSDNRWTADMGPMGGPVLGPYDLRSEALTAETDWLRDHLTTARVAA